jgi:hypothetical protein
VYRLSFHIDTLHVILPTKTRWLVEVQQAKIAWMHLGGHGERHAPAFLQPLKREHLRPLLVCVQAQYPSKRQEDVMGRVGLKFACHLGTLRTTRLWQNVVLPHQGSTKAFGNDVLFAQLDVCSATAYAPTNRLHLHEAILSSKGKPDKETKACDPLSSPSLGKTNSMGASLLLTFGL